MVKPSKSGLRLDADFTEDVVGFALESFLAVMSFPRHRFSIEPFSRARERWLGADARLHGEMRGFRPFYMQFKRPSAYPDYSAANVIKDRKALNLQASPRALYFDLREKQAHHWDFQHNILFRLRQRLRKRQLGDAAYVCPLFLERSAYRFHLHWSGISLWPRFWRHHPWDFEEVLVNDGGRTFHFDRIPVLAEHITVPPHEKVSNAKHRYSFTEAGNDLCFHSPEALPDGATNLAAFLNALSDGFLDGAEKIQPQQANEELRTLMNDALGDGSEALRPITEMDADDPIGNWFAWGDYLRLQFGIDQYALVRWRD
jgi:hypothetical protein